MKLLVFGKTGQVATELLRRVPAGCEVFMLGRGQADLGNPAACAAAVMATKADVVINAAAWTAVDKAEADEAAATVVNGEAPAAMALAAAVRGLPFLHLSTDYVFDGAGDAPRGPDSPIAPLGAYGRSKALGEAGVRAAGGQTAILRTSWVFSAHGSNFVKTMLRRGAERDQLRVVEDQIGGPTWAADIADALFVMATAMARGRLGGIWHFAGAPAVSWAGFARAIMQGAGLGCDVQGIASAEYPTPAKRPLNSRLDCASLTRDFGIQQPDWRQGLAAVIDELRGKE